MNAYDQIKIAAAAANEDVSEMKIQLKLNGFALDSAQPIYFNIATAHETLDAWAANCRDQIEADNCRHESAGTWWDLEVINVDGDVITFGSAMSA